jgi:hypothetical protein
VHLARVLSDLGDGRRDLLDARVHALDGLADPQERLAGLLDRRRAVVGALGAVLDPVHRVRRVGLDFLDQRGDRRSRLLRLLGQLADLLGHDRKAAALLARPARDEVAPIVSRARVHACPPAAAASIDSAIVARRGSTAVFMHRLR